MSARPRTSSPAGRSAGASVLVAHRHPWEATRLADALDRASAQLLPVLDDATRALATLEAALQPAVLITGDHLLGAWPRSWCPARRCSSRPLRWGRTVQTDQAREAGARVVLSHRTPVSAVVSVVSVEQELWADRR